VKTKSYYIFTSTSTSCFLNLVEIVKAVENLFAIMGKSFKKLIELGLKIILLSYLFLVYIRLLYYEKVTLV